MERITSLSGDLFTGAIYNEDENEKYFVNGVIAKEGRTLITGLSSFENFIFSCNLAISIANENETKFLNSFDMKHVNILYLDLLVGDYYMKEYLKQMLKDKKVKNLHFKCLPGLNLNNTNQFKWLEQKIEELKINILFITPLEYCLLSVKNPGYEVMQLREALDILIAKHKISVVLTSGDNYGQLIQQKQFTVYFDDHISLRNNWLDNVRCVKQKKFTSVKLPKLNNDKLNSIFKEQAMYN